MYYTTVQVKLIFATFSIGSFSKSKDKIPLPFLSMVVFKYECSGCHGAYIGTACCCCCCCPCLFMHTMSTRLLLAEIAAPLLKGRIRAHTKNRRRFLIPLYIVCFVSLIIMFEFQGILFIIYLFCDFFQFFGRITALRSPMKSSTREH